MTESLLPSDYPSFLSSIKERVQRAQLKAIVAVNSELITLYWPLAVVFWNVSTRKVGELGL
jgi:hypothetical protein